MKRFSCADFKDVTPPTVGQALQSLAEAPREGEEALVGVSRGWEMSFSSVGTSTCLRQPRLLCHANQALLGVSIREWTGFGESSRSGVSIVRLIKAACGADEPAGIVRY